MDYRNKSREELKSELQGLLQENNSLRALKEKRAAELVTANKELVFQNREKEKRADELVIANEEKDKRAAELVIANPTGVNLTASWRLPCPSGANNILLLQSKTRVTDPRQRGKFR